MATPMSSFNWYDNSALVVENEIPEVQNKALFFVVSSFDKGPEDLREIEGTEFDSLYGTPLFSKHGQNGIQAKHIIDAGGRLLIKRVCASDATLANLVLTATVKNSENDGTTVKVKWEAHNITGCKTYAQVKTAALGLLDEEEGVYPVFVYCDNGRGSSVKAIRLVPDYYTSKGMGSMFYALNIYEGTSIIEKQTISFDPTITYKNEAYGLDRSSCKQIEAEVIASVYDKYVAKIAGYLSMDVKAAKALDLVYCYDNLGGIVTGLSLDPTSLDLNATYGINLKEGSNGSFGDAPVGTTAWEDAIRKVFAGEVTDEVWDVDAHKIAAVVDANLPNSVKNAIADFVNWRKDCVFFRDLGTGLHTFTDIVTKATAIPADKKSRFVAEYSTSYSIKDPSTHKTIEVTMMYDMAEVLVAHFDKNAHAPLAGIYNGFVLTNAIKGTVNFTPIVTPAVDQKQAFEDLKLNYAIFNDDQCTVQSCYTSQAANTELSYINNVIAIQEAVRAVRTMCPRQRYKLVTGTDFSDYATACQNVLDRFIGNFAVLKFTYTEDKIKAAQKIFYASIEFAFNQWAQTEIFDIYALNSANL